MKLSRSARSYKQGCGSAVEVAVASIEHRCHRDHRVLWPPGQYIARALADDKLGGFTSRDVELRTWNGAVLGVTLALTRRQLQYVL